MRKEWLGITLALGLGLTSSAWAVRSVPGQADSFAPIKLDHWSTADQQLVAANDVELAAVANPAAKPAVKPTGNKTQVHRPVSHAAPHASKPAHTSHTQGSATLNYGVAQYKRGYIAKAIPLFEQATRQNPQSEMAFLWLGRASQKQGTPRDMDRAKDAYQKVLSINPNNLEALSALGEVWSWDPLTRAQAIDLLKRAHSISPNEPKVSRNLAEALLWQGNGKDALQYAMPIANVYGNDAKWMAEYAQMLSAGGRSEEAIRIYSTVLKDNGQRSIPLRMDQARALFNSGRRPEASILYEQIAGSLKGKHVEPDLAQAMGSLAFDLERYNDALQWDQSLPASYQRHKDIQLREARALTKAGRVPEAIEHFNRLYEAGLLSVDEKLEFAEYLRVLHLAPEALPSPNLMETLYQDAAQEATNSPEVMLRLARYYGESDNRFDDAVKAYQAALADPSISNPDAVKKEFLDFLKADKTQPVRVEALFQQLLAASPEDIQTKAAYAEYLSWQKDRRVEAMRLYLALGKADPANQEVWQSRIDEVLKWHVPTTELIPLYQDIVNLYPQDKAIWMTVARAYRSDKDYYKEAVDTFGTLVQRFPDDGTIKREWLGLLLSNVPQRSHNINMLKKMVDKNPNDPDILATYGKLLSYEHNYGPAMDAFQRALQISATHREALVGKGYVILWSGRKLEAKSYFQDLRRQFPDDVDIAIGLAQAEKSIGRYDQAMQLIQEIKPLMDRQEQEMPEEEESTKSFAGDAFILVDNWDTDSGNPYQKRAVYDFSILPYSADAPVSSPASSVETPVSAQSAQPVFQPDAVQVPIDTFAGMEPMITPEEPAPTHYVAGSNAVTGQTRASSTSVGSAPSANFNALTAEINALSNAVSSLKQAQQSSRSQLDKLDATIKVTQDAVPTELNLQPNDSEVASGMRPSNGGGKQHSVGESAMTPAYGVYSALDYDTNPLLSGVGRLRNDDLSNMEKGLTNDLRPMIRGGYLYTQQKGQSTTTRLSSYGFPNQLSFSLTPQIRLRGGLRPTRYYLPNGLSPSSNLGLEYSVGATIKYWDRLTLDGDFALTDYKQTDNVNITYNGQAQYALSDAIRFKLGASRLPQFNSLLTLAGQKPNQGFYRGDVLGQARENSFYTELNTNPFNQNWDWNLGYAWAFVTGHQIPTNHKNQAFTSLGHTWHMGPNHKMRLGYEFLYFGYGKNATSGFFDTTSAGLNVPVASLRPLTVAGSNFVYGGYYSPKFFMMNAGRVDVQGSLLGKVLEYKLGGSLGVQTTMMGHHIDTGSGSRLSSAFDGNLIFNMTDWLAAYGDVDFLNAGGQFNRWRFGGGLIVRPHIDALSPVFGSQKMANKAAKTASKN